MDCLRFQSLIGILVIQSLKAEERTVVRSQGIVSIPNRDFSCLSALDLYYSVQVLCRVKEFPGISGFSAANLWRMRLFYESYVNNEKLAPMVREIGWSHNLVIVEKCKDDLEQEFYIRMIRKFGWTKNVLIHQIENQTYEKTLLNQTNFDKTVPAEIRNQLKLAVKDEYTFDLLELADEHSERQLEQAILTRVEPFLQEMGGIFAFIGS